VLWHCWFGVRKSIRPVKNWVMRCWCGYLSAARCKWIAYGPADVTATDLTCLVPAYPGCPGKEAVKWVSVCISRIFAQTSLHGMPNARRTHPAAFFIFREPQRVACILRVAGRFPVRSSAEVWQRSTTATNQQLMLVVNKDNSYMTCFTMTCFTTTSLLTLVDCKISQHEIIVITWEHLSSWLAK